MVVTLPLARLTDKGCARLRAAFLVVALLAGTAGPAAARTAPVKVLVGATVADTARATMSPALWVKMIDDWVGATTVAFPSGPPTLADCKAAGADYAVSAPFELRPRLPGMPNPMSGRVAARSHIVITNCFTGNVAYDQTVNFDSDPSPAGAGDFESTPEITWSKNVPSTLARYPVFFPHVARITQVRGPIALVDLHDDIKPGDVLRVFAGPDHKAKGPIYLTVTQIRGKFAEAMFSTLPGAPQPGVGDFVEPVPKPAN